MAAASTSSKCQSVPQSEQDAVYPLEEAEDGARSCHQPHRLVRSLLIVTTVLGVVLTAAGLVCLFMGLVDQSAQSTAATLLGVVLALAALVGLRLERVRHMKRHIPVPVIDTVDTAGILRQQNRALSAAMAGDFECMQALVADGFDVDTPNAQGETCVLVATMQGHADFVRACVTELKADVHRQGHNGFSALQVAVHFGRAQMLKVLAELGADVNEESRSGYTPLSYAVHRDNLKCIEELFKLNADPTMKNKLGRCAYDVAVNAAGVHDSTDCDNCGAKNMCGRRHKCGECKNFDLCDLCIGQVHTHHKFRVIQPPRHHKAVEVMHRLWPHLRPQ